jgi:hypothetical protein
MITLNAYSNNEIYKDTIRRISSSEINTNTSSIDVSSDAITISSDALSLNSDSKQESKRHSFKSSKELINYILMLMKQLIDFKTKYGDIGLSFNQQKEHDKLLQNLDEVTSVEIIT